MDNRKMLEKAYENPEQVPWNDTSIPEELIELIENKQIKPCRVLEIGCGLGHHSIYLAKQGFEVTAIDISKKAINYAKKLSEKHKVKVNFNILDALKIRKLNAKFDFILEWGVLHFIPFTDRSEYVKSVFEVLNKGGKYICLTFSEESPEWGGGKIRKGITGSTIYYSSVSEIENLFKPYFKIIKLKKRNTLFKNSGNKHIHHYLLMEKR